MPRIFAQVASPDAAAASRRYRRGLFVWL